MTRDIDIMVNENIPIKGAKSLDKLLTDAGLKTVFKDTVSGLPVIHYEGNIDNYEVEIEFLTNLKGRGDNDVIEVQKGLYAEALRFIAISTQNTQELLIDDFTILGKSQELTIKVPAPGAFLFHKGLTFNRRSESQKMGKDLYYMFEVLVHCIKLEVQIYEELRRIKLEYPIKWFNNFITNLATFFKDVTSYGCRLVLSQRTHGSIDSMNDNQFKQYVLGIFRSFIERLRSL